MNRTQRKKAWEEFQKDPSCDWTEPILVDGVCQGWNKCDEPATFQFLAVAEHAPFYRCAGHADECRGWGLRGKKIVRPVTSWEGYFHTKEEMDSAEPISFLIEGFLQREGVTAIAAPVRERKSLIALNICHALLTGEKLFNHFEVVHKPERVLYLCPEVSLGPFKDRMEKIGLMEFVGTTLFCRTLSAEGKLNLADPLLRDALPGSVVVLDTAIRFLEGDENSSKDVRSFADSIFSLLKNGAEAVLLLHHSPKEMGDTMTLENAMRGSGDMGAFLACCWGTRLQDPTKPYESASFLSNLKQRDFESKDFEVTCSPDCRMRIVDNLTVPTMSRRKGFKGNKDGLDEHANKLIADNPTLSAVKLTNMLNEAGIKRSAEWVRKRRFELTKAALQ